jgi:hypothetical protein
MASEIHLLVVHDVSPVILIKGHMILSMIVNIYYLLILLIVYNPFTSTTP